MIGLFHVDSKIQNHRHVILTDALFAGYPPHDTNRLICRLNDRKQNKKCLNNTLIERCSIRWYWVFGIWYWFLGVSRRIS